MIFFSCCYLHKLKVSTPPKFPPECDKEGEAGCKVKFLPEISGGASCCVLESCPVFEPGWVWSVAALWSKSESGSPASLLGSIERFLFCVQI